MYLFRYFNDQRLALDFMDGCFRCKPLVSYQDIEDGTRRDERDGVTRSIVFHDRLKMSVNFIDPDPQKPEDLSSNAIQTIQHDVSIAWQWHALCLSTQLSVKIARKFKSQYAVGIHKLDLDRFFSHAQYTGQISELANGVVLYMDDTEKSRFGLSLLSNCGNEGQAAFYRDCFVKGVKFRSEHEYRYLFVEPQNMDPVNPNRDPFFFTHKQSFPSAILFTF